MEKLQITELIGRALWREAVTYRNMWSQEYVLSRKDGQRELLELVCARFRAGGGTAAIWCISRIRQAAIPWDLLLTWRRLTTDVP